MDEGENGEARLLNLSAILADFLVTFQLRYFLSRGERFKLRYFYCYI